MSSERPGCFKVSGPKWTESEAVFVRGRDRVGPLCGEEGAVDGEPVVFVGGSR